MQDTARLPKASTALHKLKEAEGAVNVPALMGTLVPGRCIAIASLFIQSFWDASVPLLALYSSASPTNIPPPLPLAPAARSETRALYGFPLRGFSAFLLAYLLFVHYSMFSRFLRFYLFLPSFFH